MKLIAHTSPPLTEPERLEAELDLLVDAELPEDRRRTLLQHIARSRDGWQSLAIRFLQRQVEWQASYNLLNIPTADATRRSTVTASAGQQRYSIQWPMMKLAATIVLTAGIFGLGGAYLGRQAAVSAGAGGGAIAVRPAPSPNGSVRTVTAPLPGGLSTNNVFPLQADVPVVDSSRSGDYPFAGFGGVKIPERVVIVPDGHNQAVEYPVEEVAAEKVY